MFPEEDDTYRVVPVCPEETHPATGALSDLVAAPPATFAAPSENDRAVAPIENGPAVVIIENGLAVAPIEHCPAVALSSYPPLSLHLSPLLQVCIRGVRQ